MPSPSDGKLKLPSSLASDSRLNFLLMKYFSEVSVSTNHNYSKFEKDITVFASDIIKQKAEGFTHGNLAKTLRASVSFPLALPPFKYKETLYSDGGIYNNLPTDIFSDSDFFYFLSDLFSCISRSIFCPSFCLQHREKWTNQKRYRKGGGKDTRKDTGKKSENSQKSCKITCLPGVKYSGVVRCIGHGYILFKV